MSLRYGELFAGYDGLGMGVRSVLGGETAWFSEVDPAPSRILAHHYPDTPNLGDITQVDFTQVEPVDVITGGFPCQDVSHAGRRAGLIRDGEGRTRSGLWGHMLRAVAEIRPRLVVAENVRGLLSATADSDMEPCPFCMGDGSGSPLRALGAVLGDLADIGYDARWYGLRAADVGAAHGRFRVFLFAVPSDSAGDTWRLLHDAGRGERGRAFAVRPEHAGAAADGLTLLPTPRTSDTNGAGAHGNGGPDLRTAVDLLPTPRATRGGSATESVNLLPTPMVGSTSPAAHGQISGDYRAKMADALDRWGDYTPAIARWGHVIGRPAPDPTEPNAKGNPRLSPAFVEWLMGLPAGHVTDVGITRNEALKALGNGVVPQQCAAATRAFVADTAEAVSA